MRRRSFSCAARADAFAVDRSDFSMGARLDRSSSAFADSMTANPRTRTGISVSLMRAETVAGESARISVPSVKIRPLINTTRRTSAAAGERARFIFPAWSAPERFVHTGCIPRKWVSDPMVMRRSAQDTGVTMHISRITVAGSNRHAFTYDEGGRDPDELIGERGR